MSAVRTADASQYVWLIAAVLVAAGAFFGGRALSSDGSEDAAYRYEVETPPYVAGSSSAGLSKGGFSGFGAAGLDGETIVSGRVRSVSTDSITLETAGDGTEVVRTTGPGTLRRIEGASASALRPGASVVVRISADNGDEASAVLVLSEP